VSRFLPFLLVALSILITAHWSPAPIVETPESPTPAPEQQAKLKKAQSKPEAVESEPKTKSVTKSSATPAPPGPARFAGTWKGKVNQGLLGHTPTTLTVNPAAATVELSHNVGGRTRPVTLSGNTISWHSGMAGEVTWTLTPNGDGLLRRRRWSLNLRNRRGQPMCCYRQEHDREYESIARSAPHSAHFRHGKLIVSENSFGPFGWPCHWRNALMAA
jgi:hypothetical protein